MAKRQTKDQKALAAARKGAATARAGRKRDAADHKKKIAALRKKMREATAATKAEDLAVNAAAGAAGGAAAAVVAKMATDRVVKSGLSPEQIAANGKLGDKIAAQLSDPRKAGLAVGAAAGVGAMVLAKSKGRSKSKALAVRGLQALSGGGFAIAAYDQVNKVYAEQAQNARPVAGYRRPRPVAARRPVRQIAAQRPRPMVQRRVIAAGGVNR